LALALTVAISAAHAQSTTGRIFGTVSGAGDADTVLVESSSGFSREVKVEGGRYSLSSLPLGTYTVTLKHDGAVVDTRDGVSILVVPAPRWGCRPMAPPPWARWRSRAHG